MACIVCIIQREREREREMEGKTNGMTETELHADRQID